MILTNVIITIYNKASDSDGDKDDSHDHDDDEVLITFNDIIIQHIYYDNG